MAGLLLGSMATACAASKVQQGSVSPDTARDPGGLTGSTTVGSHEGAPGAVQVTFQSAHGDVTYDVLIGGKEVCKTPCKLWVNPKESVTMKSYNEGGTLEDFVVLKKEMIEGMGRSVRVVASPSSTVRSTVGVLISIVGSSMLLFGGMQWAVGKDDEDKSFGKSVLLGASILPAFGISLLVGGFGDVKVTPVDTESSRLDVGPGHASLRLGRREPVRVVVTPFGVGGSF